MSTFNAAEAVVRFVGDDKQLGNAADRVQRTLNRMRDRMEGVARVARNMLLVGGGAFVGFVKAASDAQETMNRFRQVFGEQAEAAESFADRLGTAVGRATNQLRDSLTTFQSFFVGLGFAGDQARRLSEQMTELAIDFASFNNLSDNEAVERFISALSGSSEVLDRFGINIKEAALQQELLNMGVEGSVQRVGEQEKAVARLAIIMRAMTDQGAVGDAARTSGELANQVRALRGEAIELAAAIGGAFVPVVERMLSGIRAVLPEIKAWVQENGELVVAVTAVSGASAALLVVLPRLISVIGLATQAVNALRKAYIALAAVEIGASFVSAASAAGALVARLASFIVVGTRTAGFLATIRFLLGKLGTFFATVARAATGASTALVTLRNAGAGASQFASTFAGRLGLMLRGLLAVAGAAALAAAKITVIVGALAAVAAATARVIAFGESWGEATLAITRFMDTITGGWLLDFLDWIGVVDKGMLDLGDAIDQVNAKTEKWRDTVEQVEQARKSGDAQQRVEALEQEGEALAALIEAERQRIRIAEREGETGGVSRDNRLANLRRFQEALKQVNRQLEQARQAGQSGAGSDLAGEIRQTMREVIGAAQSADTAVESVADQAERMRDAFDDASRRFRDFVSPQTEVDKIRTAAAELRAEQRAFLDAARESGELTLVQQAHLLDEFRQNIERINRAERERVEEVEQRQAEQDERDRDSAGEGLRRVRIFTADDTERARMRIKREAEQLEQDLIDAFRQGLITREQLAEEHAQIEAEAQRRLQEQLDREGEGGGGRRRDVEIVGTERMLAGIQRQLFQGTADTEKQMARVAQKQFEEQRQGNRLLGDVKGLLAQIAQNGGNFPGVFGGT